MIFLRKVLFVLIGILLFSRCAAPSIYGNFTPTNTMFKKVPILPEQVIIYTESLPLGIRKGYSGFFEVENKYKNKIEIVGKIEVELREGYINHPGSHPIPYFIRPEEEDGLGEYCRGFPLVILPLPGFNIINPFAWPCASAKNYAGSLPESITYRNKVREEWVRKLASENGAEIVFMFEAQEGYSFNTSTTTSYDKKTSYQSTSINPRIEWQIFAVKVLDKNYFKMK
ncbi:hypothetical protein [Leptospira sarikeiensis]|uniref:Uncharacterized protein n=1 Tax=Leptospira sarikeiensis TaxID=2484943 RepID=A0A4R9KAT1_9LEPT|nr:hypothetical protein [Leptospira sarikeiensis]TGL63804.1 hypothetical protein EHQ64_04320 [Leptospira sarikeiensis]